MTDPCELCKEPLDSPWCKSCFWFEENIFSFEIRRQKEIKEARKQKEIKEAAEKTVTQTGAGDPLDAR